MAQALPRNEAIAFLMKNYAEDQLIVIDVWSSEDVRDESEDTQMDIWADIAEEFADYGFDIPTSLLNDNLYELVDRWKDDNG